jgi:starch phosphorylase
MLIADFRSYTETQDKLYARISDASELGRLSIMNVAQSGIFAADRAIREYADNIWHV